ncbi:MAG: hypothetical protein ACYS47_02170 [Planctomycetota bacterium]|jgi:hypothetical protein
MRKFFTLAWTLFTALALGSLPATAGEKIQRFTFERKAGDRIREKSLSRLDLFLRTDDDARGYQVTFERVETSETNVVEAEQGKATRVERSFEESREITDCSALSGRMGRSGFAKGKSFLLETGEEGLSVEVLRSTEGEGKLPPALRDRFQREMDRALARLFPEEGAIPDQKWKRTGKDLLALFPGLPEGNLTEGEAEFRLAEVTTSGDVPVAIVEVTSLKLVLDGGAEGAQLTLTGAGKIRVHPGKGLVLAQTIKGKVRLDAPVGGMQGDGTFEIEREEEEVRR